MSYYDYCLKFADEAEADALLFDMVDERKVPKFAAVDVIGIIYKPTGEVVEVDGMEVPLTAPVEGWHVNVRHTKAVRKFSEFVVNPLTPVRVWA